MSNASTWNTRVPEGEKADWDGKCFGYVQADDLETFMGLVSDAINDGWHLHGDVRTEIRESAGTVRREPLILVKWRQFLWRPPQWRIHVPETKSTGVRLVGSMEVGSTGYVKSSAVNWENETIDLAGRLVDKDEERDSFHILHVAESEWFVEEGSKRSFLYKLPEID